MRGVLIAVGTLFFATNCANAQSAVDQRLIDELNTRIGVSPDQARPPESRSYSDVQLVTPANVPPNWGVVVKRGNEVLDVFGQVDYQITTGGKVEVPGYVAPAGASLEVVPAKKWAEAFETAAASTPQLDAKFQPLAAIPGAAIGATDYLANELCGKKGRPSGMSLSLVVNASGNVFFASVGTEAGSEVSWDFQDVCRRYGLETQGMSYR